MSEKVCVRESVCAESEAGTRRHTYTYTYTIYTRTFIRVAVRIGVEALAQQVAILEPL